MYQCEFPLAPSGLLSRNEDLKIINENGQFVFEFGKITFKSSGDVPSPKICITLQHKETGEVLTFDDTKTLTFLPDIEKLKSKESGNNVAVSRSDLTRTYGSARDKKLLKEQEKLNVNKEAQNLIRATTRNAVKDEKTEASKGNKLDQSYMDVTLNGDSAVLSLSNLIDENHRIKLSSIAPKEVLDSLKSEAESVMDLTINDIEKLKGSLSFHPSVLDLIKKWSVRELHRIQLAILLEYLIRFLNLPIKNVRSKVPISGCPHVTIKFIMTNFTKEIFNDGGKSTTAVPKEEKEKLFLVIIALYGYLSCYEFQIDKFMVDIKTGRDRIKKFGQLIDIRMMKVNKDYVMKSMKPYMIDDGND